MSRPVTFQALAHVLGILKARERHELLRTVANASCRRPQIHASSSRLGYGPRAFASAAGAAVVEAREEEPLRARARPARSPSIPECSLTLSLPSELQQILRRKDTKDNATQFILAFNRQRLTCRHLLHAPVLQRILRTWSEGNTETHQWAWLADHIEDALAVLDTQAGQHDKLRSVAHSLLAVALVKTGRLPPAQQQILTLLAKLSLSHSHQVSAISAYVDACLKSERHGDIVALIGQAGRSLLGLLTTPEANKPSSPGLAKLRDNLLRAYRDLPEPTVWLDSLREGESPTLGLHSTNMIRALVETTEKPRLDEALAVYRASMPGDIALDVASSLWSKLDLADRFEDAHAVYVGFRRGNTAISHVALSRALHMYASRGRDQQTNAIVEEITSHKWSLHDVDKRNLLHCRALLADVDGAQRLAERFFPSALSQVDKPARSSSIPELHVLNLLLLAYVNAGRIDDAIPVLTAIMSSSTKPSIETYNTLLKAFVISGDVEGAVGVYDELLDSGLVPNVVTFTSLIGLFANVRDPENARHTFAMMTEAAIEPDERAWAALVNAHIESGQWQEVSSLWEKLPSTTRAKDSLVNAMLKAYVLLGAPFPVVERLFRRVQAVRTPDIRSWAMFIQSACDSGDMITARELYEEMDDLSRQPQSTVALNAYIYSILIAGYSRVRDGESAAAVYDEMQRRGIAPTSVTYSMLISSLLNRDSVDSRQEARDFAAALLERIGVDNLGETTKSRGRPIENVISPLILDATRNYDVNAAKSYFEQIAASGRPSIPAYSLLLDAYRKAGDVKPMLETWVALFKAALEPTSTRKLLKKRGGSSRPDLALRNLLAIPLSIMIDGLSAAARHTDVFKVWLQVKSAGFGFDAHNYNHLAIAMARSGDIEGAFRIVDRVLISRSESVSARRMPALRSASISDILEPGARGVDEDQVPEEADLKADPAMRPPNRRHADRYDREFQGYREPDGNTVDTELLKQWRPSDLSWRPSMLTIAVLDRAYAQLQSSRGVWGAVGGEGEGEVEEGAEEGSLPTLGGNAAEHGRDNKLEAGKPIDKQTAWATLLKINRRYGKAVALVMLHRRKRNGSSD